MRRYDGIGLAVLMLASFAFGSPARAEGGAPFDGRAARKALAERYEKVQRERQRSWKDEDEQTDAEQAPPEKRPVGADGSRSPEGSRARAIEPPRAPGR
jgi:hypothetical protein